MKLMLVFKRTLFSFTIMMVAAILLYSALPVHQAVALEPKKKSTTSSWSLPIKFFQKSLSRADGNRCPMYPSCSHYAAKAFKKHGAIKGWILSSDRLLRCGHDELRRSPEIRVNGKVRTLDPIEANTRWWSEDREKK